MTDQDPAVAESTNGYHAGKRAQPARWEKVLEVILLVPGGLLLLVMLVYVVANALARTLFQATLPASIELTQYWFMPLVVSVGFVSAQLVGQHVDADLFFSWFSDPGKKYLMVGVRLFSAIVLGFWAWFSLNEALYALDKGIRAGYTDIPAWPVYFAIPLAFAGMTALLVIQAWRALRSPASSFDESIEEQMEEELKESII